jgi:hypothetical protein
MNITSGPLKKLKRSSIEKIDHMKNNNSRRKFIGTTLKAGLVASTIQHYVPTKINPLSLNKRHFLTAIMHWNLMLMQ